MTSGGGIPCRPGARGTRPPGARASLPPGARGPRPPRVHGTGASCSPRHTRNGAPSVGDLLAEPLFWADFLVCAWCAPGVRVVCAWFPHGPAQRPEKNQGVPGTPKIHLIPPSRAGANRRSSNVGFEKSERGCAQNSILSHSIQKLPRESPRARPESRPEAGDSTAHPPDDQFPAAQGPEVPCRPGARGSLPPRGQRYPAARGTG